MRTLLLQPNLNWPHFYCESPSTALLILGTLAKNKGHKVKILHLDIDQVDLNDELKSFQPDIVGISVNTFSVKSAREIAKQIKAYGTKVVIGGPHASVWDGEADKVVIGEGENQWLSLIGEKPEIETIDEIPPIDYSLVDLSRFTGVSPNIGALPSIAIMASRGCPGQCTFCNTPVFWGRKVRYRNPQLVLEEIEQLHKVWGMNEVFFQDDTFNINHKWAFEIFEGIIRKNLNKEMVFRATGRIDEKLITKDYLDLAYRAGVWNIFYGIESGSQYMLDRMKKGVTVDEIKRAVRMTHEAGISTTCSFIVGLPGESKDTLRETALLIDEIKPWHHGWCFFCPFPKTEATNEVIERGHIKNIDYGEYAYGMQIVRTEAMDYQELGNFKGFQFIEKEVEHAIRAI